jgi:hypothetical protein
MEFLKYPLLPLSPRATAGFYKRATTGGLRFAEGFLPSLGRHLMRLDPDAFSELEEARISLVQQLSIEGIAA